MISLFELGQEAIIGLDDLKVHLHALLDGGVIEALDDAFSVLGFGNAAQGLGQVVLASGVLDMGKELGALSHEVIPSPQEIPRRPHLCG